MGSPMLEQAKMSLNLGDRSKRSHQDDADEDISQNGASTPKRRRLFLLPPPAKTWSISSARKSLEPYQTSTSTSSSSLVLRGTQLFPLEIANEMRDEPKHLHRRKLIHPYDIPSTSRDNGCSTEAPNSPEPMMDDTTAVKAALMATSMASPASSKSAFPSGEGNKPIFTLKQMTMICEKMCKEEAVQIREEYDRILQQKLSEQYDSFVRFIDHHIQQGLKEPQEPSYLS